MAQFWLDGARAPRKGVGVAQAAMLLLLLWLGVAQSAWAACGTSQSAHIPTRGTATFTCSPGGFDNVRSNGGPGVDTIHGIVDTGSSFSLIYTNNGDGATTATFLADDDGGNAVLFTITIDPAVTVLPASMGTPVFRQFYSQQLSASGGSAPYAYAVESGTLPFGLVLGSSGMLSGTATGVGNYNFTVRATDSAGKTGTRSYSVTVADPILTVTPTSLPAGLEGKAYAPQQLSTSGGTAPYFYQLEGADRPPLGMTLSSSGRISGVAGYAGNYSFGVRVTDSTTRNGGTAPGVLQVITVQVAAAPTITIAPASLPGGTYGVVYPTQILTGGGGTAPYTFSVSGALPPGVQLDSDGTLSGTPSAGGTFFFTVTATDANTYSGARAYSFNVAVAPPGAPTGVSAASPPAPANQADGSATVSFTAPASNGGSGITQYRVTSVPGNIVAFGTGSPIVVNGLNFGAAYQFNVTAINAAGAGSASTNSNSVTSTRQQAIALQNPGPLAFGTTTALMVSSSSGLPVTVASLSPTCEIVAANQVRALLPGYCTLEATQAGDPVFAPATAVQAIFPIFVAGGAVSIQTPSLPAPVRGMTYGQTISVAGGSPPYVFVQTGDLPPGLTFNTLGQLSGVATQSGVYTFWVTVTDAAGQTAASSYTLNVAAPVLVITPATLPAGRVGAAYANTTLATAGGIAPYRYTVSAGTLPDGLSLAEDGTISGTPTTAASTSVTLRSTDAYGAIGTQPYTLVVGAAAPVAVNDAAGTAANTAVTIPVTANDGGGAITSIAITQAPAHGAAAVSGLDVVYTPARDFFGTDTLMYSSTGPGGSSSAATVTISVTAGAVPTVVAHSATALAGTPLTLHAAEGAANGPFTAAAVVSAPSSGSVQVQGTDLVYTPADDAVGDISFSYTLSNAFGVSQPATVTVSVNPLPVAAPVVTTALAGRNLRVNLSSGARGGPFTAATLVSVSPANAGVASIENAADGYVLVFAAAPAFGGVAQIAYTLSNAYTTSAPALVSVSVTARPDPSKDPQVLGVLSAQADATRRMATGQIGNFQQRLEQLRNDAPAAGFRNGITLASASASAASIRPERERGRGPNAIDDLSAIDNAMPASQPDATPAVSPAGLLPGGLSVWTGGAVNFGKAGARRGDASTDFTTSGLSIGADTRIADGLILGAGLGYGRDDTDVGEASSAKADSYSAAVYASYRPTAAFFIDSLLGYQWLSLDSVRAVTNSNSRLLGNRDGRQWFGALSMGYILRRGDIQLTPYARLDAAQASLDAFTERGDAIQALHYQAQTVTTRTASAGALAQFTLKRDYGIWAPQLRAEYGRDLQGASSAWMTYADLVGSGGTVYRANLLQRSRDHGLLGGGLGLQTLGGWNLLLEYQLQLESELGNTQSVRFGLEKKFDH